MRVDDSDFQKKAKELVSKMSQAKSQATMDVGNEVIRLSHREVPHDKSELQNSGQAVPDGEETIVGYNKVYAARLHEHPEYNFQKGRKGKYLEDPIMQNLSQFLKFMGEAIKGAL